MQAWKVPTQAGARVPSLDAMRARISAAARLVKVMQSSRSGGSSCRRMRSIARRASVSVLPEPAPARTSCGARRGPPRRPVARSVLRDNPTWRCRYHDEGDSDTLGQCEASASAAAGGAPGWRSKSGARRTATAIECAAWHSLTRWSALSKKSARG